MKPSKFASRIASSSLHDNNNPLWKGPCGEGPLGGITQSMIVRFLSCRDRFRLRYVVGLEPHDRWNHRIGYGHMWHACEEALAKGRSHEEIVTALRNYTLPLLDKYPLQRNDIEKWHNVCCVQFPEYVKYWSEHKDVKNRVPLLQEQIMDVPYQLPSGRIVRLRSKIDSVDFIEDEVTGPGGGVYIQENKTKGDIQRTQLERQLKFDLQTMFYLISLHECNSVGLWCHIINAPILGVRYNVVRRPLSGGKGNIQPLKGRRNKPAETMEEYYERLRRDYIADNPSYWFFRIRLEVDARDIKVFKDSCLNPLLETICDWYELITGNRSHTSLGALNYRTPFGVYSALEENGATEYDFYYENNSEVGLQRVEELFTELK